MVTMWRFHVRSAQLLNQAQEAQGQHPADNVASCYLVVVQSHSWALELAGKNLKINQVSISLHSSQELHPPFCNFRIFVHDFFSADWQTVALFSVPLPEKMLKMLFTLTLGKNFQEKLANFTSPEAVQVYLLCIKKRKQSFRADLPQQNYFSLAPLLKVGNGSGSQVQPFYFIILIEHGYIYN